MRRTRAYLLSLCVTLAAGCGGASDEKGGAAAASSGSTTVNLVAYSTPQVVYDDIIADFQETDAGAGVRFRVSYGPSGEQSRAVAAGLAADVVAFALSPDVDRLVAAGLVSPGRAHQPIVSTSRVVFIVRKGNPKGIKGWDDLLADGVEVVTANPLTSGGAKWNIVGAFAHGGVDYVEQLIAGHVRVQPRSAREALHAFIGGRGDVVISYESEAILARINGASVDYVTPPDTVRIDLPIAVTKSAPPAAKAFVDFALSRAGQAHFAEWGYRPAQSPVSARVTTVDDLGGWASIDRELFDPDGGAIARIEERTGRSAGG